MNAAAGIGRIGALAVALGVGAAVTTGTGIATAAPAVGGDTSSSKDSSAQSGASAGEGADADSKTAGAQAPRSAATPRRKTKGPLASIADRVRKDVEDGVKKARKNLEDIGNTAKPATSADTKGNKGIEGAEDTAAGDVERPAPSGSVVEHDTSDDDAATSRVTARSESVRARLRDVFAAEPPRRSAPAVEVRPDAAATVPDLTARDTRTTVTVRLDEPADPVRTLVADVRGAKSAMADPPSATLVSALAAPDTTTPAPRPASALVTGLLAAAGLAPLAGNGPAVPTQPPALLALVAWARREVERTLNPAAGLVSVVTAQPTAAVLVDPDRLTAEPPAPALVPADTTTPPGPAVPGQPQLPNWVTGGAITDALPFGVAPGAYGIAGTDLGIMWDDGAGHVLMLFGDTFDEPGMAGVWRNNALLRSIDRDLTNGLQIQDAVISPGGVYSQNTWSNVYGATQVIRDPGFLGLFGSTRTIIPTAAISVTDDQGNVTQYANVMSVRTWDTPGRWTTNWSAIAYSTDGGLTWTVDPNTVRSSGWLRSSRPYVAGNVNFQQGAFVQGPETDVDANGVRYVYSFGTPSGRGGSAYVSRVAETDIRDLGAYEYWAGEERGWVAGDPSVAVPVIGATGQAPPRNDFLGWITKAVNDFLGGIVVGGLTGGNVSEMSVQYNPYLQKYVVLYTDGGNNVVMRVSDSPQGTWSDATTLVANRGADTGMYAPMIHPWSGTDELGEGNEQYLYWNLSYWGPYNVQLKQTDLAPLRDQYGAGGTIAV